MSIEKCAPCAFVYVYKSEIVEIVEVCVSHGINLQKM